jgi:hypothetical protein
MAKARLPFVIKPSVEVQKQLLLTVVNYPYLGFTFSARICAIRWKLFYQL